MLCGDRRLLYHPAAQNCGTHRHELIAMKCLVVSDLHYALPQYDWTAEVAAKYDVVVIAGDHLDISGHVDGRTQIIVIQKYLRRLADNVRLIASSGNHDLDARDAGGEKVTRWI